ncbi:hypothetical protein Pla52o_46200 [Novipirellula galeiformis]|uniref:Uncharacterized protein n=1 Tax=Novipirellula galeiformis TaxID=2528004 RepID=A0A5C6C9Q2_9BACT|nr:hypothetical protein Pla52o_46200 [Novipirellula galeiformis]
MCGNNVNSGTERRQKQPLPWRLIAKGRVDDGIRRNAFATIMWMIDTIRPIAGEITLRKAFHGVSPSRWGLVFSFRFGRLWPAAT